jgi:hypothetical protein
VKFLFFILLFSVSSYSETFELGESSSTYEVKAFGKTVDGKSKDLKGKMNCNESLCEFLVAVAVKSFISTDANRDDNMKRATEASKLPVASGSGKFPKENLAKDKWILPLEVDFHGRKHKYDAKVEKTDANSFKANFVLKLDQHDIDRPSIFGFKIHDEVPISFDLRWGPAH